MLHNPPSVFTEGLGVSVYVPFGFPKRLFGAQAHGPKLGFMCGLQTHHSSPFLRSFLHSQKERKAHTHTLADSLPSPSPLHTNFGLWF